MADLPLELLSIIWQLAASRSHKTAFSLVLVCRASKQLVTPLLWRSPYIRTTSAALSFLLALNRSWGRLAPLVKSISLAYDYAYDESLPEVNKSDHTDFQSDEATLQSNDNSMWHMTPEDPEWIIQRLPRPDEYKADDWRWDDLVWHALQATLYELPNLTSLGVTSDTYEKFSFVQRIANTDYSDFGSSPRWPYTGGLNPARCIALDSVYSLGMQPQHLQTSHLHFYGCRRVWNGWTPWHYMSLFPEAGGDSLNLCLSLYSIDVTQTDLFDLLAHLERHRWKRGARPFQTIVLRVRKQWAKWVLDRLAESRWKARHKVQVRLWETGSAKSAFEAQVADFENGHWESWVDELDSDGGIGRLLTSESIQALGLGEEDIESDDSSHSDGESVTSMFSYPSSHVESDFEPEEPIVL
jgi:hypothetical protein